MGLVFTGEGDGHLVAFDSATGERLWQFNCGSGGQCSTNDLWNR